MKAVATGLFGLAALIYVVTIVTVGTSPDGWLGYLQAGAEAAMVGALADWFAVTALFRHPLGLPIPHTAIIPTRKDQMGATLGEFVGTHFLTDEVVREKVTGAEVTRRGGEWLADPDHAARVAGELGRALRGLIAVLDDEQMRTMIERVIADRVERTEVSPALGHLLGQVVDDGAHTGIVDVLADRTYAWVVANRRSIIEVVTKQAPTWTPKFVDGVVGDKIHLELVRFLAAIRDDPQHDVRIAIDRMLVQFADDMRPTPAPASAWSGPRSTCTTTPTCSAPSAGSGRPPSGWCWRPPTTRTASCAIRASGCAGPARADPGHRSRAAGQARRLDHRHGRRASSRTTRWSCTSVITDTVQRWDGPADRGADRAGRGPRPAVHPDQRDRGRRPGGPGDPRAVPAGLTAGPTRGIGKMNAG